MVLVVAIIAVVSVLVLMAAADMDVVRPDHCHSINNIVVFSEKERRMGQYQRKKKRGEIGSNGMRVTRRAKTPNPITGFWFLYAVGEQ